MVVCGLSGLARQAHPRFFFAAMSAKDLTRWRRPGLVITRDVRML